MDFQPLYQAKMVLWVRSAHIFPQALADNSCKIPVNENWFVCSTEQSEDHACTDASIAKDMKRGKTILFCCFSIIAPHLPIGSTQESALKYLIFLAVYCRGGFFRLMPAVPSSILVTASSSSTFSSLSHLPFFPVRLHHPGLQPQFIRIITGFASG